MKTILIILSLLGSVNCSSVNKDKVESRWHENCPYTEDNCGYPYESYTGDMQVSDEKKEN